MVALFDQETGDRISNAKVHATVVGPDGASSTKELESMVTSGVISYGNYFRVPDSGSFKMRERFQAMPRNYLVCRVSASAAFIGRICRVVEVAIA
jgi:hypothetical protein